MEVHSHAHTPQKKWTHYVWEFIMLFLAVFCGFLAENLREHGAENQREKRYMQNMLQDLVRDTVHIHDQLIFQQRAVRFSDSLVFMLNGPERDHYLRDMYYYARMLAVLNPFLYSNATITQLKNSGSLRLIKEESVSDSLVQYDVWTQRILMTDGNIQALIRDFRSTMGYVFDAVVISNMSNNRLIGNNGSASFVKRPDQTHPLITDDRKTINQLCVYADFLASLYQAQFNSLTAQKGRAVRLIALIKKEYQLE